MAGQAAPSHRSTEGLKRWGSMNNMSSLAVSRQKYASFIDQVSHTITPKLIAHLDQLVRPFALHHVHRLS